MDARSVILIIGVIIIALAAVQGLLLVIGSIARTHREAQRQQLSLRLLDEQVAAIRARRVRSEQAVAGWAGWRKFEVTKKEPQPGDICSFYLQPHDGKPISGFKPGQYLTFQLHVPGQDKPVVRCYSLSEAPRPEYYRVSIKRVPPPRDKPDAPPGLASGFFHDHVKEGDILDVRAPSGHFFLDMEATTPLVLIGGGIGVTPVLAMLNALTAQGELAREVYFFLGVRHSGEHPVKAHLRELDRRHEKLHLHVCYSNPLDGDEQGADYHHGERVSVGLFKRLLPSNNFEFYLCGPPPMMESIVTGLDEWGVPDGRVHFEAFGPASVKRVKKARPGAASSAPAAADGEAKTAPAVEVVFARSGKTCDWREPAGSLLDLAEANGIALAFGCRAGNCGTCLVAVKEGDVAYPIDSGAEPEAGSCLTCIGAPKSRLVLDA